ncbi:MAG: DMT family transporter [Nitrospirae bacterium]|nr:MAG: DMT family transporter [Nitrospirota bacterium]
MSIWLGLALTAAFCESLKDLLCKRGLLTIHPLGIALATSGAAFPFLLGFFLLTQSMPVLGEHYITALLLGGSLNILALIQFMRALQAADLSLTMPFITFTPLFLLLTSPVILGEFPALSGLAGMILIVFGAYLLHIQEMRRGALAPFAAIVKDPGPRRMLSVAAIYSVTSTIDKLGVINSSPVFWSLSLNSFMVVGLLCLWLLRRPVASLPGHAYPWPILILIGVSHALTLIAQNLALAYATVPAVITIKRTSVLFAVIWGALVLRETSFRERFLGAACMVLGIGLIGFSE